MEDKRRFVRDDCSAMVEISHPHMGIIELKAKDLSDGGVFVFLGQHVAIPIGTLLNVRIKRHTGIINIDPVSMRVVHHNSGGMGLMFI